MNLLKTIFGFYLISCFTACKKSDLPKPVAPSECWQKFIGHYTVYDTAAGISYPLTIEHILDTNTGGYVTDFLKFTNFDNQFNFSTQFSCMIPSNQLNFGFNVNLPNYLGDHYNVWYEYDDTTTLGLENLLSHDTLKLYFNLENTAYWNTEGVPYVNVYKHQTAIKLPH